MASRALQEFQESTDVAELLWRSRSAAAGDYARARRQARMTVDVTAQTAAKAAADEARKLQRSLVQAALVRVVTAWEVFLHDLVAEYLAKNPKVFRDAWGFGGRAGAAFGDMVTALHRRPFQNLDSAKSVLRRYLGKDVLGDPTRSGVDFSSVVDAIVLRNAIVHRAGRATRDMRDQFGLKRQSAEGYLLERPVPAPGLPATRFQLIKARVLSAALALDQRAWMSPPRAP